jgi:hypothetical protein
MADTEESGGGEDCGAGIGGLVVSGEAASKPSGFLGIRGRPHGLHVSQKQSNKKARVSKKGMIRIGPRLSPETHKLY